MNRLRAAILGLTAGACMSAAVATAQLPGESCAIDRANWAESALRRALSVPLGLPPVPFPADNPPTRARIELGRKLFFDRRLSINKTVSCAMCHVPEQAFVVRETATAVGVEGRGVKRNAPTVLNVAYLGALFHDGRENSLETQFIAPLLARNEMANPSIGFVVDFIRRDPQYDRMFDAAFDAPASPDRVGMALASYQRTLLAADSPFDRFYFAGETDALDEAQKRGLRLFTGTAGCSSCHEIGRNSALFTDQQFHDTGYLFLREHERQLPPRTVAVEIEPGVSVSVPFGRIASVGLPPEADLGRYEVTEAPRDRWRIRTAPLRNVAATPPYMHDGRLATLGAVVEFYDSGGPGHDVQDPRIRPLGLSEGEKADLVAFLNSLTSPGLACLAAEARVEPPDNQ
jgi:cytochrome c peroxidase